MKTLIKYIGLSFIGLVYRMIVQKRTDQITVLMTFEEDLVPIIKALQMHFTEIHVYIHPRLKDRVNEEEFMGNVKIQCIQLKHYYKILKSIKNSKILLIDNYYLFLGGIKKRDNLETIQVWHASSAFKKFGTEDRQYQLSSKLSRLIYNRVYRFTDSYMVAGSNMKHIFQRVLNAEKKNFIEIGLPRLNFKNTVEKDIEYLFVPTYRTYKLNHLQCLTEADIPGLIIKSHPFDKNYRTTSKYNNIATMELIRRAKVVITDYSSLAVDAINYGCSVKFYVPDEKEYNDSRGLNQEYFKLDKHLLFYAKDKLIEHLDCNMTIDITDWINYQSEDPETELLRYLEKKV